MSTKIDLISGWFGMLNLRELVLESDKAKCLGMGACASKGGLSH